MTQAVVSSLPVTPSDVKSLFLPAIGLYIGKRGSVTITSPDGVITRFRTVPQGTTLWVSADKVNSTGTTAGSIIALFGAVVTAEQLYKAGETVPGFIDVDDPDYDEIPEPSGGGGGGSCVCPEWPQYGPGPGIDPVPPEVFRVWYDLQDLASLSQDVAGTVNVTGVGQPVAIIRDKGGNNYHLVQPDPAKQALLQQDENGKYYIGTPATINTIGYSCPDVPLGGTATIACYGWAGSSSYIPTILYQNPTDTSVAVNGAISTLGGFAVTGDTLVYGSTNASSLPNIPASSPTTSRIIRGVMKFGVTSPIRFFGNGVESAYGGTSNTAAELLVGTLHLFSRNVRTGSYLDNRGSKLYELIIENTINESYGRNHEHYLALKYGQTVRKELSI